MPVVMTLEGPRSTVTLQATPAETQASQKYQQEIIAALGVVTGQQRATYLVNGLINTLRTEAGIGAEAKVKPIVTKGMLIAGGIGALGVVVGLVGWFFPRK